MDNVVMLFNDNGKVVVGRVTYHENWYEDWKKGIGNGEIVSIEFDEGETPSGLTKEDIQSVYDQVDKKFKEKMGVNYEQFCAAGKPTFKEVMKAREEKQELDMKQISCGVRPKKAPIIEIMADTQQVQKEIEVLRKKLEETKRIKESEKCKDGCWKKEF